MKSPSSSAAAHAGLLLAFLLDTTAVGAADTVVGTATLDLEHKATSRKVVSELCVRRQVLCDSFEVFAKGGSGSVAVSG